MNWTKLAMTPNIRAAIIDELIPAEAKFEFWINVVKRIRSPQRAFWVISHEAYRRGLSRESIDIIYKLLFPGARKPFVSAGGMMLEMA